MPKPATEYEMTKEDWIILHGLYVLAGRICTSGVKSLLRPSTEGKKCD